MVLVLYEVWAARVARVNAIWLSTDRFAKVHLVLTTVLFHQCHLSNLLDGPCWVQGGWVQNRGLWFWVKFYCNVSTWRTRVWWEQTEMNKQARFDTWIPARGVPDLSVSPWPSPFISAPWSYSQASFSAPWSWESTAGFHSWLRLFRVRSMEGVGTHGHWDSPRAPVRLEASVSCARMCQVCGVLFIKEIKNHRLYFKLLLGEEQSIPIWNVSRLKDTK